MPIPDLLWACPECGEDRGLAADGSCRRCGVVYTRGPGATIRARRPDGHIVDRPPDAWVDALPGPEDILRGAGEVVREARVLARFVVGSGVVRDRKGSFVNRIERFGPDREGTIELTREAVTLRLAGKAPRRWPLETLTAIQASSRTLQIKPKDQPLVSLRFLDDSIFLWEVLLATTVREVWRRTGRGDIAEFQPRIVGR
jgi:hypothetical protein